MKTNILITGATGKTELPVVERLARMNVPFRVMVHPPAKENLVQKGLAEVVGGDFHDAASRCVHSKGSIASTCSLHRRRTSARYRADSWIAQRGTE